MHSGIGDNQTLSKLGIQAVHHLPSVGQNYSDQPIVPLIWFVNSTDPNDFTSSNASVRDGIMNEWKKNKTGPLADGVRSTISYFRLPQNATVFKSVKDPAAGPNTAHVEIGYIVCVFSSRESFMFYFSFPE
jgi:choline dehydrogenase-like flavoprotein